MTSAYSIAAAIGLSAACGFRVFIPFLLMSLGATFGIYEPSADFAWIGSPSALGAFGLASVVEVAAYYVPWLDNLLDTIATPAAVGAGVVASASVLGDLPPSVEWPLALIGGGGAAGAVQGGTVAARGTSSASTGGAGNFLVATGEAVLAVVTSLLAMLAPILALAGLAVGAFVAGRWVFRRRRARGRAARGSQEATGTSSS